MSFLNFCPIKYKRKIFNKDVHQEVHLLQDQWITTIHHIHQYTMMLLVLVLAGKREREKNEDFNPKG